VLPPLRVGIVDYLNSRPLAWSFLHRQTDDRVEPVFLPPARVAAEMAAGTVDVGLIPSIEVQRIPGVSVLPGLCVAATREVRSVLLLSRRPPARIERLALDRNSRTSAALVRIWLKEGYGVEPICQEAAPDLATMMRSADAALVIGDPALRVDRSGYQVHDLAREWRRLTDRPFVFAVWAVAPGVELGSRLEIFYRSLAEGQAAIELLVRQAAAELGLGEASVREYLTQCLSFELGSAEREGLQMFFDKAHRHGLIPEVRPIRFHGGAGSDGAMQAGSCCDRRTDSVE